MEKQRKKKEALARWHGIKQCDGDRDFKAFKTVDYLRKAVGFVKKDD